MLGRSVTMRLSVALSGWLTVLCTAGEARAHRLILECHVLPGGKVQVESWFDRGGSPKSAKVQVFHAGGQLFSEGSLDGNGIFVFSIERVEQLRVVVSAGDGHRAERIIPQEDLARSLAGHAARAEPNNQPEDQAPPTPLSDRSSRISATDVVAGVGLVFALAAFVMSWRNARRLRCLQAETSQLELRGDLGRNEDVK